MTSFPFFPLNIVVFPGEQLNLHIFEPRYKDLLRDCIVAKSNFCIPSYVNNKIEYGTEIQLLEVEKDYEDGRADIKTKGVRVVKINSMNNPFQDKLYAVGEVTFLENIENGDYLLQKKLKLLLTEFFQLIEVNDVVIDDNFKVFDFGHEIGLSKELEYELLGITEELQRQKFLLAHLEFILPKLRDINQTKAKIKMNGHFRKYDPLDF